MALFLGLFGVAAIIWSLLAIFPAGREAHWRYETADLRMNGVRAEKSDDWEGKMGLNAVLTFIVGVALLVVAIAA